MTISNLKQQLVGLIFLVFTLAVGLYHIAIMDALGYGSPATDL